ncbi:unnamed protein product [Acidocella sp. C78]|nr:unnamed protein product [Acidocella sp. C78]
MEIRYFLYAMANARVALNLFGRGTTFLELSSDALGSFRVCSPPLDEQRAIAAFLDRETAKIDALIAEQERLIALLQEKRQAVISQAVTKGLDPTVPMKDSGAAWMGMVPAHWAVTRFGNLVRDIKAGPFGSALTKDIYVHSGYRVYGQEQVIPGDFSIGDYYIDEEKYQELKNYAVCSGDILISCVGTFGKIAIVPPGIEPGIINPRLIRVRFQPDVMPEYAQIVLKSPIAFNQMAMLSRGGTMDVINIGTLKSLVLPIPSMEEQQKICTFVSCAEQRTQSLVDEASRAIALLRERRAALISAAVTGKIDVRDVAGAEPAEAA